MKTLKSRALMVLAVLLAACGQQLVEFPPPTPVVVANAPPTVTATTPLPGAVGVLTSAHPSATFSKVMAPASISTTTFTLSQGGTPVGGAVSLDVAGTTATFVPTAVLLAGTLYTATITTGVTDLAGLAMVASHVWTFTTAALADTTPPTVIATTPLPGAIGVLTSVQPTATFSEPMATASISTTTFTLSQGGTPVGGAVTLDVAGTTATFAPTAALLAGTLYTATITTGVTDVAANALVAAHVWTFTTASVLAPTVIATTPLPGAISVLTSVQPTANFSEPMATASISTTTFTLSQGGTPVGGAVTLDLAGTTATFAPTAALLAGTLYTATITTGAQNLATTPLAAAHVWTFTTAAALPPPLAINLGAAATFGIASRAGLTSTGVTVVNGDVALYPLATCTDATGNAGASQTCLVKTYVSTTGMTVNGSIFFAGDPFDAGATALQVTTDLTAAWVEGKAKIDTMGAVVADEMAGGIFTQGVYHNANLGLAAGGTATLDALGDANAIFIFKVDSTFVDSGTLLLPTTIALLNGAQARNVWFVVGLDITIGSGTSWKGNILAGQTATVLDGSTVLGRVLAGASGAGAITLTGAAWPSVTSITVP